MTARPFESPAKPRPLIFILAPSYSGSTLLTFLLSRHQQVATIGELKATSMGNIAEYRCSCGDLILECEFWQSVTAYCRSHDVDFSVESFDTELRSNGGLADRLVRATVRGQAFELARSTALKLIPGAGSTLRESMIRNAEIADAVCAVQRREFFLDSSKTPARLRLFAESGSWDLKVINLHRDGRGVSNSTRKHLGISMREASRIWAYDAEEIRRLTRQLHNVPVVTVRYEDLCRDPEKALATITDAFGLDRMDLEPGALKEGSHHILGNNMRLNSVSEILFDETWRSELSEQELQDFDAKAGEVNRALGYAAS